jgi:hypothetical protein
MNKSALVETLLVELRARYRRAQSALSAATEAATGDDSKAEGKYDTRGLEASYPAGMAWQTSSMSLTLGTTQWIADINFNAGSISFQPGSGRLGVFGFSFMTVDFGELEETIRFDNDQGFLDLGTFSPMSWVFGFGYARTLSSRFSVGGQVKYASENLGSSVIEAAGENDFTRSENEAGVLAFDFGVLYKTGFRSLNFAVNARNFSEEIAYVDESFQLPLTLKIGLSMDVADLASVNPDMHSLLVTIDAENPRDFSEQIKIGTEYIFLRTFALRAGYIFPTDEQGISLGLGVQQSLGSFGFGADYAYTDFGIFSGVHRLALRFTL